MNLDAKDVFLRLEQAGNEWAELQAASNVLEDTTKTVLARLMQKSTATSINAKEMEALASNEYEEHIKAAQEAKAKALKAKVRYDAAKVYVELARDQAHTERALLRGGA